MLQRNPTRVELKPEDKEEYDQLKEKKRQEVRAALEAQGKKPLSPLLPQQHPPQTTAQRLGLHQPSQR